MKYTVKVGDTLTKIAEQQLGNWKRWIEILNANSEVIRDDPRCEVCLRKFGGKLWDWIFPGQVFIIPRH